MAAKIAGKEKNDFFKIGLLLVVLICALAVIGVLMAALQPPKPQIEFKQMPRFENYDKLAAYFSESSQRNYGLEDMLVRTATMPLSVASSAGSMVKQSAESDSGFSRTNVQVEGVDEADIVKTDGKFIYNFSKNRLIITDAYPIEGSEIVSKTDLSDLSPLEMFIEGNRLLVFASSNSGNYYGEKVSTLNKRYYYGGSGSTVVRIYNIGNKASPSLEKEFSFEGSYLTSRLIGKNAYFVVNAYPRYYGNGDKNGIIPLMQEDGVERTIAEPVDIGYLPPMPAESFVTLASINLDSKELQKETIAGSAESVFASEQGIYISGTAWLSSETPVVGDIERVIVGDSEKTIINKFGLDNGTIGFLGQGSVPGHVLNQFSMDEFEGNFRIATTAGQVSQMVSQSTNNLYVLDSEMNTIGKLEGLAPGEKIYSARFMGKKAYMVTFKKVDPLFVIDLSIPTAPKVLGKLKIPGYSDYLHPIDETHIIGIGKDTIASSSSDNFAWYQGLKMAVFDVSDVSNPKEMHKIVIGDRGTDSFALQNHKAFLYDKEKELLVLPISLAEIPAAEKRPLEEQSQSPSYGTPVFQGAFVYRLTLENGFEERGRITHIAPDEELKSGYYYGDESQVQRSLFIGNVLYTLSDKMLKANSLTDLKELKEFKFD
ncbi:MAG: beta-propeller domain-containing protein [Candidatus Diapherotrites archaeon]|nr:beta-propeller domain-containing protein [Candidatus Diapherotrites archaeon]